MYLGSPQIVTGYQGSINAIHINLCILLSIGELLIILIIVLYAYAIHWLEYRGGNKNVRRLLIFYHNIPSIGALPKYSRESRFRKILKIPESCHKIQTHQTPSSIVYTIYVLANIVTVFIICNILYKILKNNILW